jgi:next-to-BRCA1 protein 1
MNKLCSKRETDEKEKENSLPPAESVALQTVIHRGVECDGCRMFPIQGNRYKCYTCPDYDLCEICEEAGKHPIEHPMLKIRLPVSNRQYRCSRKSGLPRAQFVEDRTLRDGISCYPGITVVKTWALKNHGEFRWPQGVQLLFLSGDLAPESVKEVPRAEPGATVEVSATIVLPMVAKQYTGYYRLATEDGKKFGPRFWVDVIVVSGVVDKQETEAKKAPVPVPEKKVVESTQPVPDQKPVGKPTESLPAKPVDLPQDSSPSSSVPSDIPQLEDVHTTKKPSLVEDPKSTEVKVEAKQEQKRKEEVPKKPVQSPYAAQLEILHGMGFKDAELNAYLLGNNEGNVQRVVEWIISHGVH